MAKDWKWQGGILSEEDRPPQLAFSPRLPGRHCWACCPAPSEPRLLLLRAASTNERFTGTRSSTPALAHCATSKPSCSLLIGHRLLPSLSRPLLLLKGPIILTLAGCHYWELAIVVVRPSRARHCAYFKARNRRLLRKEEGGSEHTTDQLPSLPLSPIRQLLCISLIGD